MLAKFVRRIRRRSIRPDLEGTQDTRAIQIVVDELQPQREVVDTAPDLLRLCSLEVPFPTVSFGGYMKYYRDRTVTTGFTDTDPLFSLSVTPSHPISLPPSPTKSSLSPNTPECPTTDTREQETEHLKTPRKAAARHSFSGSFSISEKSPKLFRSRWRRATCIISSSIAEHDLTPLFSRSPNSDVDRCPSFEIAQSLSSKGSAQSDSPYSPDSITLQFRHTTTDSEFTLPPDTPISIYSNLNVEDAIVVVEPHDIIAECSDLGTRTWLQRCRPVSSSSYMTAQSVFG